MRMIKSLIIILMLTFSLISYGLDRITVNNHEKLSLLLSKNHFSRIFVERDRINSVKGELKDYLLETDEKEGDIYIKPIHSSSFFLYITTEQGKTIQLFITPSEAEANTVAINIKSPISSKKDIFPPNPWQTIINLIRENKPIAGSKIQEIKESQYQSIGRGIYSKILKLVNHQQWQGQVYQLKNKTSRKVKLSMDNFYTKNTVFVYAGADFINPHEEITLYKVLYHAK